MLNLDTHILVHALTGEVTTREKRLLSRHEWSISAIVLWELAKLSARRRIDLDLDDPETIRDLSRIHTWPITLDICRRTRGLDFEADPADELIAATSIVHNVPLLTRDRRIRQSKIVPFA